MTEPVLGAVNDPLEREADAIADHIMRGEAPGPVSSAPSRVGRSGRDPRDEPAWLRRGAVAKGIPERQGLPAGGTPGRLGGALRPTPPIVAEVLRSPGTALPPDTRRQMERSFGRDFASVRLHRGSHAAASAQAVDAAAYTVGRDIVVADGGFAPETCAGDRRLLAHELAHVAQQGDGDPVVRRQPRQIATPLANQPDRGEIVRIVVTEGAKSGKAYFADGTSKIIDFDQNKLEPGDYALSRTAVQENPRFNHYAGTSERGRPLHNFVWHGPSAEHMTVVVVPVYVRDFIAASRDSHSKADADPAEEDNVARILTRYHVSENELLLEHRDAVNARVAGTAGVPGDAEDAALSLVGRRQADERTAVAGRSRLLALARRLATVNNEVRQIAVTRAKGESYERDVSWTAQANRKNLFSWGQFDNQADLDATFDAFAEGLESELHATAEGMLNEAAATIFKVQRTYIGTWDRGIGYGYLGQALDQARQDKDVKATQAAIAGQRKRIADVDAALARDNAAARAKDGAGAGSYSQMPAQEQAREARAAAEARIAASGVRLQRLLGRWNIHLDGVQGVDAPTLLASHADQAQAMLANGLADASRRIEDTRRRLEKDREFVFKADRIVALEKAQLGVAASSPVDQIIDAIVREGASPTTFWGDLWDVISFVVGFVPPPAGPIMRAVVGGVALAKTFSDNADQSMLHEQKMSSTGPSSMVGSIILTAAGALVDAGDLTGVAASEREALTFAGGAVARTEARAVGAAEATFAREVARATGTAAKTVESEIAELEVAVAKPGRLHRPASAEYDAELTTTRNADGEVHTYDRETGTDTWCRHSDESPCNSLPELSAKADEAAAAHEAEAAAAATATHVPTSVNLGPNGLPVQVHDLAHPIGPAFATFEEAQAVVGPQGHILQVVVEEDGHEVASWWEASEGGMAAQYPEDFRAHQLGHTEQKALRRLTLRKGIRVELRGTMPPCPYGGGCMNTMSAAAQQSGAEIVYRQMREGGAESTFVFDRQ
ncbi:eCIS core domain-containing protein [Sphingomonas bacterium]|uniref:eCIS core domain-containing protein n=1 Tax=Sphingomonas bacterium TaxID=1895847 RepID=UPI00157673B9|nr:DUF4157 domain-containing protein [Sphingomonas bacterium]